MKNLLLNNLSFFLAKRFESAYTKGSGKSADFWLNRYINTRRRLPKMIDGNHWGNHFASDARSYKATQGWRVSGWIEPSCHFGSEGAERFFATS